MIRTFQTKRRLKGGHISSSHCPDDGRETLEERHGFGSTHETVSREATKEEVRGDEVYKDVPPLIYALRMALLISGL